MPGDWICANCGNSNFAKRRECRRCNAPRTSQCRVVDDRSVQADRAQDRRPRAKAVVPGDWYCGRCGNHNFQWRDACKRCGAPKAADSQVVGADQSSPSGPSPSGVPPSSRRDSDVPVPLSTSAPPVRSVFLCGGVSFSSLLSIRIGDRTPAESARRRRRRGRTGRGPRGRLLQAARRRRPGLRTRRQAAQAARPRQTVAWVLLSFSVSSRVLFSLLLEHSSDDERTTRDVAAGRLTYDL
mmetsp:Transcript_11136/g.33376  ORF Transcript_11136/g.33376 Transcript_11136/m.33376 type:complete len:240 (+) Transcript_11136:528-1247(+)